MTPTGIGRKISMVLQAQGKRILNPEEKEQSAAKKIISYIEAQIQSLREANDSLQADEVTTAQTRGRIAELNSMLKELTWTPLQTSKNRPSGGNEE